MRSFPSHWHLRPLGEVATLQRGFDLPVQNRVEGRFPIFAANGSVGTHAIAKVAGPGVVTGRSGSIGKVHYVNGDFWPLNTALWVKDFHGNDTEWVAYLLRWLNLNRFSRGGAVPTLNRNLVHLEPVPVPPVNEQRRIAARIKECMERVDEIERLRATVSNDVEHLAMAFRYELWELCSAAEERVELRSVAESAKNGLYKPKKFHGSGSVLLRMFNINDGHFHLNRVERIQVTKREAEDYQVNDGDIIVSRVNSRELVGKSALIEALDEPAVHEAMIIRLRVDEDRVSTLFLVWLMNSPQFLHDLRGRAKHAIGQSSINQDDLLSTRVPLPSLNQQEAIVKQKVDFTPLAAELAREYAEQQKLSTGLRESILHKAFAGEL